MALRLTTDDRAIDLTRLEMKLAIDHIKSVINSQINSSQLERIVEMRKAMTADDRERFVRDIAANLVQSLL